MKSLVSQAVALTISSAFAAGAISAHAATPAAAAVPAAARADNAWLSEADAMARSARVSNVAYVLDFKLTSGESFSATTTLNFDLSDASQALTVDLDQATISALTVNGKAVTPKYNKWFITLAAEDLRQGRNTVTVSYERKHSTNGEGLHRMVDPADGRVYTYSHFEPAAAHQMFALFDQPDLKATYQLNVTAPADWQVVSMTRENAVQDVDGAKRWTFPVSKKLSAYNFSLHAGPYKVWEDKTSAKYPMRLMARQSLAAQVQPEIWFRYTAQGLKFFDEYFGVPYQFDKYDQILVPDFLYGAMENAGAVTFGEARFVHKDEMTAAQRESLATVIMHEMAHQWFGDLVTMKWWNGLWLNESFASFMATLAAAEATEFKNGWQSFYTRGKVGAYEHDQRVTTHPIEVPVPSTANAFDNIDAITYSKGASTLKQLRHLLGQEVFRKGVHNYLVKYSWQNAKLDDFIGSLGEAAGRDLGPWTQQWLYQPGVNTITASYTCKGGKLQEFSLQQSAPAAYPVLREQRVQVGLFVKRGGQLQLERQQGVTYKGASTVVENLAGEACPDLVYPNYEDWGFAKVKLDARSFATARQSLRKVDDPLLRTMLWSNLWDSVRDGDLPLNDFLQVAQNNLPYEKDYSVLGDVIAKVDKAQDYLNLMAPGSPYAQRTAAALEKLSWTQVLANKGNSNFQRRWFELHLDAVTSRPALARLAAMLDGREKAGGLNISQDLRWDILRHLSRHNHPGIAARIEAEQARDNSDSGQAAALAARVISPDPQVKQEWLAKIGDLQSKLPFSRIRTAMGAMYPAEQHALSEQSAAERLRQLPLLDKAAGPVFMRAYGASMIPATCTPASVQRLAAAVEDNKELSTGTRRALLLAHQEDARCVAIRRALTVPLS
ncbi:aminopeptidase N [Massilia sp. BJB1822]|uniref:aminopeptidase N n=1 Tax=Massilia sp. BJB1822 TaxID=2744470 RepID=UPI001592F417|nr:aminopeptidase N [Massilia sp. BJB1822]NVE01591.1 aminopeptidase N [Massilia sp. BJB1822]